MTGFPGAQELAVSQVGQQSAGAQCVQSGDSTGRFVVDASVAVGVDQDALLLVAQFGGMPAMNSWSCRLRLT